MQISGTSKYLKFLSNYKLLCLISSLSSVFSVFAEGFAIFLLSSIIVEKDINLLNFTLDKSQIIFYFTFSALIAAFLHYLSDISVINIQVQIEKKIRINTTNNLLSMNWTEFIRVNQGDIAKSISIEGLKISQGSIYLLQSFNNFLSCLTYFIAAVLINKTSALILISYLVFVLPVYYLYSRKAKLKSKSLSSRAEKISAISNHIFNNLKLLKSSGIDSFFKKKSLLEIWNYSKVYRRALLIVYKSKLVLELIAASFIFVIVFFRGESLALISSIGIFIRMAPRLTYSQSLFIQSLNEITYLMSYENRIKKIKNNLKSDKYENPKKVNFENFQIRFKSVSFSYNDDEGKILENCDLEVNKNEFIAICGKSGSGKTTITDLITGLIYPEKGSVEISSQDIKEININHWRQNIGIVMQDAFIIDDTVARNISLGSIKVNEKRVKDALKLSGAWEFVKKFKNGIDENLFDYGSRLSGGQKQRISIARALYRKPKLLILDEPTSSLDSKSSESLKNTIYSLKGQLTIIIISHKSILIENVDRVYELSGKKLLLKSKI